MAELGTMADSAARVRVFSDDGKCVSDAGLMRRALEYVKAFDGVIAQHAQEPRLTVGAQMNEGVTSSMLGLTGWPAVAEEAVIARDCLLTAHVGSRLHVCHVSTAGSVELVRWAKSKGWDVTAEVTPHHLVLTDDLASTYDPVYKVNPPLRTAADVEALRAGLADGTIDVVATDHAPHALEDKEAEWGAALPGMTGLETALAVVVQTMVEPGRLTWRQVAERLSATPGAHRPARRARRTAGRSRSASRPTSCSSTPAPPGRSTRARRPAAAATPRSPGASCPRGSSRRSCAAGRRCSTVRGRRRHRPRLQRPRRWTASCSPPACCSSVVALWLLMLKGWRGRRAPAGRPAAAAAAARRSAARSSLPATPGLFVGTTFADDWLDRVAVHDLAHRAAGWLRLDTDGVTVEREGLPDLYLPYGDVERRQPRRRPRRQGHRPRRHGPASTGGSAAALLTSGFRADDHAVHRRVVDAVNAAPARPRAPPTQEAPR